MRIYFVSDVHGSEVCFRKFLNSYPVYKPDVMIIGGDITGKSLVPLIEQPDGSLIAWTMSKEVPLTTEDDIRTFERYIADQGMYTWRFEPEEYEAVQNDAQQVDTVFHRAVLARVEAWMRLAEERLKDAKVRVLISGGNDDFWEVDDVLKSSTRVECPDERVVDLDQGIQIVSCGLANQTPWRCPRDVSEEELLGTLEKLAQRATAGTVIFNVHVPPYDTSLDSGPLLDADNRPKMGFSGMERTPVGSTAVRTALERFQPLLSLHGHVHESRGSVKIGGTLALNPGSEYGNGLLRGVIVEIKKDKVKSHQWTCG
jgi:uncharacterized protein